MKKGKLITIIYIILMTLLILCTFISNCNATQIIDVNKYVIGISEQPGEIKNVAGKILGIIRLIGIILSVLVLAIIGIEYIIASPEGKADYKKNMMPYIIGIFLLLAGTTIPKFIYDAVN